MPDGATTKVADTADSAMIATRWEHFIIGLAGWRVFQAFATCELVPTHPPGEGSAREVASYQLTTRLQFVMIFGASSRSSLRSAITPFTMPESSCAR